MQSAAPHREAELLVRFRAGISHTTRKLLSEMSQEDAYANISFEKEAAEYARNIKEAIRKQYGDNPCDKYKP